MQVPKLYVAIDDSDKGFVVSYNGAHEFKIARRDAWDAKVSISLKPPKLEILITFGEIDCDVFMDRENAWGKRFLKVIADYCGFYPEVRGPSWDISIDGTWHIVRCTVRFMENDLGDVTKFSLWLQNFSSFLSGYLGAFDDIRVEAV